MKISKLFSGLFALLGIAVTAGTLVLCLGALNREPVLLEEPRAAVSRVESLFQAICDDDYAAASSLMYGTPDLGSGSPESGEISTMIWNAYVDSLDYALAGDCYPTRNGLAQRVQISYLDISSVTDGLQVRSRALLQERVGLAEDVEQIYDENNEYRQDFVDAVVNDAAREALAEDARYVETELTVQLVFDQGQWWILADDALMQAISGGIVQ